jgi:hypothetical protein
MPGDSRQRKTVMRVNFEQVFRRRLDQDDSTVDQQAIALGEIDRLRQVEKNIVAAIGFQQYAAPVAGLPIERNRVDDSAGSNAARLERGCRAQ